MTSVTEVSSMYPSLLSRFSVTRFTLHAMASNKETEKSAVILVKKESEDAAESSPATKSHRDNVKILHSENPSGAGKTGAVKKMSDIRSGESMELTPPIVSTSESTARRTIQQSLIAYYNPVGASSRGPPKPAVKLDERPLVLATHLVPSLPVALFEILAEIIEATTGQAVVIVHETRVDRPVAKDLVDIAILPASKDWDEGALLPVSFVFQHPSNGDKDPAVYVDIVVSGDNVRNVEEIVDLRGHRCAVPDRHRAPGAATLLFDYLKTRGENPSFFGNTLDSGSQLDALRMVASKQADLGVLESPVINCYRNSLPGFDSVYVLTSLGPLPPYRLMLNNKFDESFRDKIKDGLLDVERDEYWTERLRTFGVTGFAEYSEDRYDPKDLKSVVTSVPYY